MALVEADLPERIGKYRLGSRLGAGGCGVVLRAYDPFVGRTVAIKLARHDESDPSGARETQERFFAEARAAGRLSHPHIVAVHDAGVEAPWHYIVMEYVPGRTLQALGYRGQERPRVQQVVDIIFRCAKALDYAHRQGVIHRDIKPGNVLLTTDDEPRIADFSIALRSDGERDTTPGIVYGTPHYMAPEQICADAMAPPTDLYALGALMFELLTGRRPFEHPDRSILFRLIRHAPAPALREFRRDVPRELEAVVARALAKAPDARFQSGAEMAAALSSASERMKRVGEPVARERQHDLLETVECFAEFAAEELDAILEAGSMLQFSAGDRLIREGDVDQHMYVLVEGRAAVVKGGVRLETLKRGDCFGEMGFLGHTRRSADIRADSDVVLLRLNRCLIEQAPAETQVLYYRSFTDMLIRRLALTSERLAAAVQGSTASW